MAPEKPELKPVCKEYQLDIVDLATNETTFLSKEKRGQLLKHLAQCQNCRDAFLDYEDIYATAVAEEHTKTPEFKKKMDDVITRLKNGMAGAEPKPVAAPKTEGEVSRDAKQEIGLAAGKIYNFLKETGKASVAVIRKKTGLIDYPFYEAIGWLACQERINISEDAKNTYVRVR